MHKTVTLLRLSFLLFLIGCNGGEQGSVTFDIAKKTKNEIYYFPAKQYGSSIVVYQPLKRFDLIFTGYDLNSSSKHVSTVVPGKYTHVLSYIGKDTNGFAYAVEMNTDENNTFTIAMDGVEVGGSGFHVFCLGKNYGKGICPNCAYSNSMDNYDYRWSKRLQPELEKKLLHYEDQLLTVMQKDLGEQYPFKLPLNFSITTPLTKAIPLVEYTHKDGSDCVSYFVSLYEEVAKVCFDDIRINAEELTSYYLTNPVGREAFLPAKYNPSSNKDILIAEIITKKGYFFVNNPPRRMQCSDSEIATGIPTPDLLFNSKSLVDIKPFGM